MAPNLWYSLWLDLLLRHPVCTVLSQALLHETAADHASSQDYYPLATFPAVLAMPIADVRTFDAVSDAVDEGS